MLDDRESQAGTTRFSRSALVDTIKAFRQTRNVIRCDAKTGIGNFEATSGRIFAPCQRDAPSVGRVTHSIRDNVAKRAAKLLATAAHEGWHQINIDLMPSQR